MKSYDFNIMFQSNTALRNCYSRLAPY